MQSARIDLDQLNGRYQRLKDELASAYAQQPWPTGRIDRLAEEIAQTELAIALIEAPTSAASTDGSIANLADQISAPSPSPAAAKPTARTPSVPRNRLTPFGTRVPQAARE